MYRPFVLVVLDGWGLSNTVSGNPIREANLPTFEKLNRYYPMTSLQASGISMSALLRMEGALADSRSSTLNKVVKALSLAGIEFVTRDDGAIGVILKTEQAKASQGN